MKRLLAHSVAFCYSLTDSLSVFIFFYSNLGYYQAFLSLLTLMVSAYVNNIRTFSSIISDLNEAKADLKPDPVISGEKEHWLKYFSIMMLSGLLSVLVMSGQIFSTYVFLEAHLTVLGFLSVLLVIISSLSLLGNVFKFYDDISCSFKTAASYFKRLVLNPDFTDKHHALMYWVFKISLTGFALFLGYMTAKVSFTGLSFLITHSAYFSFINLNPLFHGAIAFILIPSLSWLAISKCFEWSQSVHDAFLGYYNDAQSVKYANIGFINWAIISVNAIARSIAATKLVKVAKPMVFISSVAGDLDDLKFIQKEDTTNAKPQKSSH